MERCPHGGEHYRRSITDRGLFFYVWGVEEDLSEDVCVVAVCDDAVDGCEEDAALYGRFLIYEALKHEAGEDEDLLRGEGGFGWRYKRLFAGNAFFDLFLFVFKGGEFGEEGSAFAFAKFGDGFGDVGDLAAYDGKAFAIFDQGGACCALLAGELGGLCVYECAQVFGVFEKLPKFCNDTFFEGFCWDGGEVAGAGAGAF